jgi:hypothetical protein
MDLSIIEKRMHVIYVAYYIKINENYALKYGAKENSQYWCLASNRTARYNTLAVLHHKK